MQSGAILCSKVEQTRKGIMTTFGQTLRQLRKERGISQRDLAAQAGVDFTYISKIEHGHTPPPSEEAIWQIARALDTDPTALFNLAGKVPARTLKAALANPLLAELIRALCERPLPDEAYRT